MCGRRLGARFTDPWLVCLILLLGVCSPGMGTAEDSKRTWKKCMGRDHVVQSFQLPKLRLQWDSWTTSQLTTAVAGLLLYEKLGFDVELVSGISSRQMYKALSEGQIHLAFEAWPASNPEEFQRFAGSADNDTSVVRAYPYTDLFGRSGIFETCSRSENDEQYSKCMDPAMAQSPALLEEVLFTEKGRTHFSSENVIKPSLGQWLPPHCKTGGLSNCSVQILHVRYSD